LIDKNDKGFENFFTENGKQDYISNLTDSSTPLPPTLSENTTFIQFYPSPILPYYPKSVWILSFQLSLIIKVTAFQDGFSPNFTVYEFISPI